jgi:hypothetical protein
MSGDRRDFLRGGTATLVGAGLWVRAPQATADAPSYAPKTLTPSECHTLDALGDTLLPSAAGSDSCESIYALNPQAAALGNSVSPSASSV